MQVQGSFKDQIWHPCPNPETSPTSVTLSPLPAQVLRPPPQRNSKDPDYSSEECLFLRLFPILCQGPRDLHDANVASIFMSNPREVTHYRHALAQYLHR
ncbi:hypothetical protein XENTR_v10016620 [Xenopus tropicalis]|nr:hypothetical protein XENTR_v10016620 [Xenopus tropicalis]